MTTYDYIQTTTSSGMMFFDHGGRRELNSDLLFATHVFQGESAAEEPLGILEEAFRLHNSPRRPRGQDIRSMSVGDFLVIWKGEGDPRIFMCRSFGWTEVKSNSSTFRALESIAARRAYSTIKTPELLRDLSTYPLGAS